MISTGIMKRALVGIEPTKSNKGLRLKREELTLQSRRNLSTSQIDKMLVKVLEILRSYLEDT